MGLRPDKVLTYLHAGSETSTRGTSARGILNKVQSQGLLNKNPQMWPRHKSGE